MSTVDRKYLLLALLVALSFFLRFWGIGHLQRHFGDEAMHIPAAENYHASGHANPDHYIHPPLKYIMLQGSMRLFGNNPYGWRMRNVLLGALTVAFLFLIGRELFSDNGAAFLAAAFLALDPMHILLSRSTFDEVPAVFFSLAGLYFMIRYLKGRFTGLVLAGCFFGLAISTKWYVVPAIPVMAGFTLWYKSGDEGWSWPRAADIAAAFFLLPLSIYLLVFFSWFERGNGLAEFVRMQVDAYREMQLVQPQGMNKILLTSGLPWEWFARPIIFFLNLPQSDGASRYIMFINDPPVWLLTIPAVAYFAYRAWIRSERILFAVPLMFFAVYVPLLFIKRPLFLYSAIVCIPLSFLAIAGTFMTVVGRSRYARGIYGSALAMQLLWGVYLYPLTSARPVPDWLYAPLISSGNIYRPF